MAPYDMIVKVFKEHDRARRGVIDRSVLQKVMVGVGHENDEADCLLTSFVESKGGDPKLVHYEDFILWLLDDGLDLKSDLAPQERVRSVFLSYDPDGTGSVPVSTLRSVLQEIQPDQKEVDRVLEESMKLDSIVIGSEVKYDKWIGWMFKDSIIKGPMSYYAQPRGEILKVPRVLDVVEAEPAYSSIDEFREKHANEPHLLQQLRNRVRVCGRCSKPNAYTMKTCNNCSTSLAGIEESFNDNLFMGFIYGIAKGKFPYMVSTRRESPDMLAFDDPLGVGVAHMCVIPTNMFCPDLRYLFRDPVKGLKLVDDLMEFGRQAMLDQYWSHAGFRKKYWCDEEPPKSLEDMIELAVLGFNFPPSMFQLHLQFIHGPLFPFHEVQARRGEHFHHGRFFPFEYVRAALAKGEIARMDVDADTKIEDVIDRIAALGFNYDTMHANMMQKCERFSQRFDVWHPDDFEYIVTNGKVVSLSSGLHLEDKDAVEIQKSDNAKMKNYGNPKNSYYKHMKKPGEVKHFPLLP
mmetsp:Transcript_41668/g.120335  ORF Transcript_41668/g.120335 Transcript_41668/m.120335 type:complete len:519 (-) Transcript_41668:292-1848(-)